ncbi:protein-glutamate O-methyltransferase CheR [Porticoccaceae bacterium LTM1]|nr:protein-glutamate O-methyltransferase CheR [Porticoccaceae bacterium LTM1]
MIAFNPLTIASDLTPELYGKYCQFIYERAGITLPNNKQTLVAGRITRRMRDLQLHSTGEYWDYVCEHEEEAQYLVDALTTNETRFFREQRHFDRLTEIAAQHTGSEPFKVWSAACSSGEEPYSVAMVLAESLGTRPWQVLGSDINCQVLEQCRLALYPINASELIPRPLLTRYCLEGVNQLKGRFTVVSELKQRVNFRQINLNTNLPMDDLFDVIFLRNVLIYFDPNTIRTVINRVVQRLKPGGYLFIGHSENLRGVSPLLQSVEPSVYRRV